MLNSWQAVLSVVCLSLGSVAVAVEGSTLEGRVFGPDNQPIKGADIRLESSSSMFVAALAKTDVRGQYRFRNVAPGTYKVTVSSANVVHKFTPDVMVEGDKRVNIEINPANSAAPTKGKHLVRIPPSTGTQIGGRGKEVDDTGVSTAALLKGDLNTIPVAYTGAPRSVATSVVGGTQGTFIASQLSTKPRSH